MKQLRVFLTFFLLILFSAGTAQAVVLFSNFGEPGDTYNMGGGWTISGPSSANPTFTPAMSFMPSVTGDLTSIDFVASLLSGTNKVDLSLVNDNGGAPLGSTLESWIFNNQMGAFNTVAPILTADSVLNPLLQAGTVYWLIASPLVSDTWAAWNWNFIGDTGTVLFSTDGGATWGSLGITEPLPRGVFRVNASAVPEPSTAILLGAGLAGVGLLRRRFKK